MLFVPKKKQRGQQMLLEVPLKIVLLNDPNIRLLNIALYVSLYK